MEKRWGGGKFGNFCRQAFGTSTTVPGRDVTISYVVCEVGERKRARNFEIMLSGNKASTLGGATFREGRGFLNARVPYSEGPWVHIMGQVSPSYYGVLDQVPCC